MRFLSAILCGWAFCGPIAGQAGTLAYFHTPLGLIEVELFDADKPATVQNFIRYVESGAYQDMFVHRWEPSFVIQGGGYYVRNRHTTNAAFALVPTFGAITNEYSAGRTFSNVFGTIAMARVATKTNSATSQWFFNLGDNRFLDSVDGGFTVFGRAIGGTNILQLFNAPGNGIYRASVPGLSTNIPVVAFNATIEDLVYVGINVLTVKAQIKALGGGSREIAWQSASNRLNRVEFASEWPPVWKELISTNGSGQMIRVTDDQATAARLYRIRVD
jgi:cyclophilin family peptidyl-prolyl cis-trans isomerase